MLHVGEEALARLLAVVADVDPRFELLLYDVAGGFLDLAEHRGAIHLFTATALHEHRGQTFPPRQAAGVRGQNTVLAPKHRSTSLTGSRCNIARRVPTPGVSHWPGQLVGRSRATVPQSRRSRGSRRYLCKESEDANVQARRFVDILRGVRHRVSDSAICARRDAIEYRVLGQQPVRSDQGIRGQLSRDRDGPAQRRQVVRADQRG